VKVPSYRNVTTNENDDAPARRPPFEPPLHLCNQFLQDEEDPEKGAGMDAEPSHPKYSRILAPGKCIPQAPVASKYVIKSTRVGEHTQFMKDHSLIEIVLGIFPSKKDLSRQIKT